MYKNRLFQVDAFTSEPFKGNPAGVCLLNEAAPDDWMKLIAREMNLSETAFLVPDNGEYQLRWFTPAVEVDLCGHATLASAHVLWETGLLQKSVTAKFHTKSGLLQADFINGWVTLDFPSLPPESTPSLPGLESALGCPFQYCGKSRFDYLVEVESETVVRHLSPDFGEIAHLPVRGVIVTSRSSTPDYDFVSRFFAPAVGVNEDPVTGSAHCVLTPYWSRKLGQKALSSYQASLRGGKLKVEDRGDRVSISGQAVTTMEIRLMVPE
jgi:PhzF family phenazine biosynthesis protein